MLALDELGPFGTLQLLFGPAIHFAIAAAAVPTAYLIALASGVPARHRLPGMRRLRGLSLRAQVVSGIVLIACVSTFWFLLLLGERAAFAGMTRAAARLGADTEAAAHSVDAAIDVALQAVGTLARIVPLLPSDDARSLHAVVASVHRSAPQFLTMLVTDANGIVTAAHAPDRELPVGADVKDRAYFRDAMAAGTPIVSDALQGRGFGRDRLVAISAPWLGRDRRPAGVAQGSVGLDWLGRAVAGDVGRTDFLLADGQDRVVYATPAWQLEPLAAVAASPVARALLATAPGTARLGPLGARGTHLFSRARTAGGWSVVTGMPLDGVREATRDALLLFVANAVLAFAVAVGLAYALALDVTRPLKAIEHALRRLALDKPVVLPRLERSAPRELRLVAGRFRQLQRRLSRTLGRLQRTVAEQEALIAERTTELAQRAAELEEANRALERLARHDVVTDVPNHRAFAEQLDVAMRIAARIRQPVAVVIVDVDYFKLFNDTYGHPAGDACLARVAQALQHVVRRSADFVARYGGEEFAAILMLTSTDDAQLVADAMCESVRALAIEHRASPHGIVTISAGAAALRRDSAGDAAALVQQADRYLYAAKRQGRNRAVAGPLGPETAAPAESVEPPP